MHFAGSRADLRVCRHRVGQLAAEVVDAQRFQVIADFIGQREFHQGERLTGVPDDMGIGDAGVQIPAAVIVVGRDGMFEALGAHPAVAVPGGAAVFQPKSVDHSVADAPVTRARTRVGAVAQVPAVQFGGDAAFNRQVEGGQLVVHGGIVAGAKDREDSLRIHGRCRHQRRSQFHRIRRNGRPLVCLRQQRRQQLRARRRRDRRIARVRSDDLVVVEQRQQR